MIWGWILISMSIFAVSTTLLAANGKIAPNGLLGIRTPATQQDEASWCRAHRTAARVIVPGSVLATIIGVLLIVGTIDNTSDSMGEIALLGFVVLVGISAFVADRAARRPRTL